MGYNKKQWTRRIAERTDMSSYVVHLTRAEENGTGEKTAMGVLLKILAEQKLIGSSTQSGFIVGDRTAVCFQDAPLSSICQNTFYEQKYKEKNKSAKTRYNPIGLMFPKTYVYAKGGRPVIYDKTSEAKNYLPQHQWWRIVNFDLSNEDNIIDWTHEREWRVPGDFNFDLSQVTVLLVKESSYKQFLHECRKLQSDIDILESISGVVVLSTVLF